MTIDSGWVAAIASVASAVVVATTAIAAFVQLRYVRSSNEITVFLRMIERTDSPEFEAAFAAIEPLRDRLATDGDLRMRLSNDRFVAEFHDIGLLLQFMEHLSTLVVTGHISETLVMAEYADNVADLWDNLGEMVYLRRMARGPYVGVAFEHLAIRAKHLIDGGLMQRLYGRLDRDPRFASLVVAAPVG